ALESPAQDTATVRETGRLVDAHDLLQTPDVAECIDASADAAAARAAIERLADAAPDAAGRLVDDATRCLAFVTLAAASRSLTDAVIADPSLLDVVDDPSFLTARDPD